MARLALFFVAGLFVIASLFRVFSGRKLAWFDYVLMFISFVIIGSMAVYIIGSN